MQRYLAFAWAWYTLAAMMIMTRTRLAWLLIALAGMVAMAAHDLPYNVGLILAVVAGIAAGLGAEQAAGRAPAGEMSA